MSNVSKIGDSELEIMRVLWADSPLTAMEIFTILSQRKSWSKSTVITLANRLVEKGALDMVKRGSLFYSPIVSESEYTKYHTETFLKKMFNGEPKNLLAYFCDNEGIKIEDLDQLKQILEDKEM